MDAQLNWHLLVVLAVHRTGYHQNWCLLSKKAWPNLEWPEASRIIETSLSHVDPLSNMDFHIHEFIYTFIHHHCNLVTPPIPWPYSSPPFHPVHLPGSVLLQAGAAPFQDLVMWIPGGGYKAGTAGNLLGDHHQMRWNRSQNIMKHHESHTCSWTFSWISMKPRSKFSQ